MATELDQAGDFGGRAEGNRAAHHRKRQARTRPKIRVSARYEYADGPEQRRAIRILSRLLFDVHHRLRDNGIHVQESVGGSGVAPGV